MSSHINTVLGPVPAEDMGIVDAHTHAWIEAVAGADPDAPQLDDRAHILQELSAYRAAGGSALVDCQPGDCGRNGNVLSWLARESGVHIVASTGFHLRRYYGPEAPLWRMSAGEAYNYFMGEIGDGLTETRHGARPVRPGLIKIAAKATLAQTPRPLLEAAAAAAAESGYALEVHTEKGAAVEELLDFFQKEGLLPSRLVFCHVDKRPAFELHSALAGAGVLLEYDTFFRPKYDPEHNVWPLIERMVAAGHASQLALATDMADAGMWRSFGGAHFTSGSQNRPGLPAFITKIQPRLRKMGIDEETIKQLLGGNIVRRLALAG